MEIKVLGAGCANCQTLETRTREALQEIGIDATVEKVTDFGEIASYGVMSTPALTVDGEVVLSGRVPARAELNELIRSAAHMPA